MKITGKRNFYLKTKKIAKKYGKTRKALKKEGRNILSHRGVNEMINDGSFLLSQVKKRLSKILLFESLKIAKFFAKRTFRRTAPGGSLSHGLGI